METTVGISKRPHTLCSSADEMETELGTELQCDLKGTEIKDQNRDHYHNLVPRVLRLLGRQKRLWGNGIFFPEKWGSGCCAHA